MFRAILILPWALSQTMLALTFGWIFNSTFGPLNGLLFDLGLIDNYVAWFASGDERPLHHRAWPSCGASMPFAALLYLGALQTSPTSWSARHGSTAPGTVRRFFLIKLPWIRETVLIVVIIAALNGFLTFSPIYILTGGGPGTETYLLSWWGYRVGFVRSRSRQERRDLLRHDPPHRPARRRHRRRARAETRHYDRDPVRPGSGADLRRATASSAPRTARRVVRAVLIGAFLCGSSHRSTSCSSCPFQSKADSLSTPPNWFPAPDFEPTTRASSRRAFSNAPDLRPAGPDPARYPKQRDRCRR